MLKGVHTICIFTANNIVSSIEENVEGCRQHVYFDWQHVLWNRILKGVGNMYILTANIIVSYMEENVEGCRQHVYVD